MSAADQELFQSPNDPAECIGRGRILIVDDRPEKLLTLAAALEPLGREIVTAGSGRDALRHLMTGDFAVVLLDVNMPGMDGFETARLIRQRAKNEHTPIIFITLYGDDVHAIQGYSLRAVDFIVAPVVPDVLRSKVQVLVELFERTQEVHRQADRLLLRTKQLQSLAHASLAIHAAPSVAEALQIAVDAARSIIGADCACAVFEADFQGSHAQKLAVSPANAGSVPGDISSRLEELKRLASNRSGRAFSGAPVITMPALEPGSERAAVVLSAELRSRDGQSMGTLLVAGTPGDAFTADEEALVTQLSQMAATAVENTLFAEAREANRLKDEFLATLSHELRTPLSAILGWVQLLRTQTLDADETAEALEIIERNGRMQHKLVEDLLDVSRIVTGKVQLNIQSVSLTAVIRAALDVILPAALAKQVAVDATLDERADRVQGDQDRLQQVLWNLLSNALKFTPEHGHIEVRLEFEDKFARVVVQDSGEGIGPEFLPYVFDRFRQADSSTTRRHSGLGIGLAIVRHVVELHGGSVRVESAGKGRGTTFSVLLPLAPADATAGERSNSARAGGFHELQAPMGREVVRAT